MNSYKHQVHYYETDMMGVVHHSNYIRWFFMSEGCEGSLGQGQEVIDLVRSKGFSNQKMDNSLEINYESGEKFLMETFEAKYPKCGIVYGVLPVILIA